MLFGAWLGLVRVRLREGRLPVPRRVTEENITADAAAFGVKSTYYLSSRFPLPVGRIVWLDECLSEIHVHARGKPWEEEFWHGLMMYVPTGLPTAIALDLVDRDLCVSALGHCFWESEEVWWKLVDRVPEAVLNLALHRYLSGAFESHRIEEILNQFPWWAEIARMLAKRPPSSPEKADWLVSQARERAITEFDLRPRERWHPEFEAAWRRAESLSSVSQGRPSAS